MTNEEAREIIKQFRDRQGNSIDDIEALDLAIKALEQQPKTGHWLDKKTTIKGGHGLAYGRYGCSVCKKKQPSKTDFCPCCGADMRGENNEME